MVMPEALVATKTDATTGMECTATLHVVRVSVLCVTGITVDCQKEIVGGTDQEKPAPPEQLKAVVALLRNSETHGISARSKRLHPVTSLESNGVSSKGRYQRYLAVWGNRKGNQSDEAISFEAKIPTDGKPDRSLHHQTIDLVVGLASAGNSSSLAPIAKACLSLAEAARMHRSNEAIVMDLPVSNFTSPTIDPFATPLKSNFSGSFAHGANSMRLLPVSKRDEKRSPGFDQKRKKKALGYDFFIDPAGNAAVMRVKLEIYVKESNVEVGLKEDALHQNTNMLVHTPSQPEKHSVAVSPLLHATESVICEPSIERVLRQPRSPIARSPTKEVATSSTFLVNVTNKSKNAFELAPAADRKEAVTIQHHGTPLTSDDEANVWGLNAAIERVLSTRQIEDSSHISRGSQKSLNTRRTTPPLTPNTTDDSKGALAKIRKSSVSSFGLLRDVTSKLPPLVRRRRSKSFDAVQIVQNVSPSLQSSVAEGDCSRSVVSSASSNPTVSKWAAQQKQPLLQKYHLKPSSSSSTAGSNYGLIVIPSSRTLIETNDEHVNLGTPDLKEPLMPVTRRFDSETLLASSMTSIHSSSNLPTKDESIFWLPSEAASVALSVSESTGDEPGDDWKVEAVVDYSPDRQRMHASSDDEKLNRTHLSDNVKKVCEDQVIDINQSFLSDGASTRQTMHSAYSTSLPTFAHESVPILKEKFDDDSIVEKKPYLSMTHLLPMTDVNEKPKAIPHQGNKTLFRLLDVQSCSGRIDDCLEDKDISNLSVTDSLTLNDNSTSHTVKNRKETLRDDLADFGLLLSELCRPKEHPMEEDATFDGTASYQENSQRANVQALWGNRDVQRRWMSALKSSTKQERKNEFGKVKSKQSLEDASATDTTHEDIVSESNTSRSGSSCSYGTTIEDDATEVTSVSEQGTEVNVNDVEISKPVPQSSNLSSDVRKSEALRRVRRLSSERARPLRGRMLPTKKQQRNFAHSPLVDQASIAKALLSTPATVEICPEEDINQLYEDQLKYQAANAQQSIPAVAFPGGDAVLSRPTQVGLGETTLKTSILVMPPALVPTVNSTRESNSGKDDRSPTNVMNPPLPSDQGSNLKSLARSFVDMVEFVMSPGTPEVRPPPPSQIALVPSVLEADDASSVGDLTATTYEMQIDIEELKRQIEQNEQLILRRQTRNRVYGKDTAQKPIVDNYFADYAKQGGLSSGEEVNDAVEASIAKRLAEGWSN